MPTTKHRSTRATARAALVLALALAIIAVTAAPAAAVTWPWIAFTKHPSNPVYTHTQSGVASDPTVIKDGTTYRMVVSGALVNDNNQLVEATSTNGVTWSTLANGNDGVIVPAAPGSWDCGLETPELIKTGTTYRLFYQGYCSTNQFGFGNGDLGMATSSNGTTFQRLGTQPVLARSPGWYDQDSITDPTVIDINGTLHMIYTGWCLNPPCGSINFVSAWSLTATSTDGGQTWQKGTSPLTDIGLHPDIVLAPDGAYHVYYNNDSDAQCNNRVAIRRSRSFASPFGPFENDPAKVLCQGAKNTWEGLDFGFPAMLNDGGAAKMWYTGVKSSPSQCPNYYCFRIGLATAS